MKRSLVSTHLAAASLAALLFASALSAQERPRSDDRRDPLAAIVRCLSVLDLSESQQAQITQFLESEKAILQSLAEILAADKEALEAAIRAGDPCAIGAAYRKVQADEEAIRAEVAKILDGVKGFLTAEQKARFEGCMDGQNRGRRGSATGVSDRR